MYQNWGSEQVLLGSAVFSFWCGNGQQPHRAPASSEAALRSVRRFPFYAIKYANSLSRFVLTLCGVFTPAVLIEMIIRLVVLV